MGKRSKGEGNIRKLENGTWRAELMAGYTDVGKRHVVRFSGKTRAEVLTKIQDFKEQREANIHLDKKLSFGEFADLWYADYRSQVQPSTYAGYKYTLALLKKQFGAKPICEILPLDINRYTDLLVKQGYSSSQLRKCRAMLIQIFTEAEHNGLVLRNPALRAKKVRKKRQLGKAEEVKKDAFTDEEVHLLNRDLPCDLIGHGIRGMLGTGLRVQELIALTADDIAEDGSWVDINKAIEMVGGKPHLDVTKSELSTRIIPVPASYRPSFIYLREHGGKDRIYQPGNRPYYGVGSFRRRYYTALKKVSGVRALTPHCCRHTYATQLEKQGVPLQIIAKLMGHTRVETTGVYLHTKMDTFAMAVEVLNPTTEEPSDGTT